MKTLFLYAIIACVALSSAQVSFADSSKSDKEAGLTDSNKVLSSIAELEAMEAKVRRSGLQGLKEFKFIGVIFPYYEMLGRNEKVDPKKHTEIYDNLKDIYTAKIKGAGINLDNDMSLTTNTISQREDFGLLYIYFSLINLDDEEYVAFNSGNKQMLVFRLDICVARYVTIRPQNKKIFVYPYQQHKYIKVEKKDWLSQCMNRVQPLVDKFCLDYLAAQND